MGACIAPKNCTEDVIKQSVEQVPVESESKLLEHSPAPECKIRRGILARFQATQDLIVAGSSGQSHNLDWLNFVFDEIWPYFEQAIQTHLMNNLQTQMRALLPFPLNTMVVRNVEVGHRPPILGPLHAYSKVHHKYAGVQLDMDCDWHCDGSVVLDIPHMFSVGVEGFRISGVISLILRPLISELPVIGGVQFFMITPPSMDWHFTGGASVAEYPIISSAFRKTVFRIINSNLVLPNRIFYDFGHHLPQNLGVRHQHALDIAELKYPRPECVMALGIMEASIPHHGHAHRSWGYIPEYHVTVNIGLRSHTTSRQRSKTPQWQDGWGNFFVYNAKQQVNLEVCDHHIVPNHSNLVGGLKDVTVLDLLKSPDDWWPIFPRKRHASSDADINDFDETSEVGKIRLQATFFELSTDSQERSRQARNVPASCCAVVTVQLERLRGLPKNLAGKAFLRLKVKDGDQESHASRYREPSFVDSKGSVIDGPLQKLIEYMALEQRLEASKIAEVSGVEEAVVERIVKVRPTFTAHWEQGFHLPIADPESQGLGLELLVGEAKKVIAVTEEPFMFQSLLEEPYVSEEMMYEGIISLKPSQEHLNSDDPKENSIQSGISGMLRHSSTSAAIRQAGSNLVSGLSHAVHKEKTQLPEGPFELHLRIQMAFLHSAGNRDVMESFK